MTRQRRPPFAAIAALHQSAPFASLIVISGPQAWSEARNWRGQAVILPPGEAPEGFNWGVVRESRHAFVIDTGERAEVLQRLGRCLIHAGAVHVAINSRLHGFAAFKAKGVAHAA
ncbi:MAG: hypothetical protein AB1670_05850 [Pseudomonadota bacterium]